MIRAFTFYLLHSLRNQIRSRLKRLRQPKYLVSALAGIAYLYFAFFRQVFFQRRPRVASPVSFDPAFFPIAEVGFAFLLFVLVLLPWLSPAAGQGITFTEAEVQFLFPAPFRRRDLLLLRIIKGQIGIIFGVFVSVVIFGRGNLLPHTGFLIITLWLVYTFLALYRMATSLAKTSLAEHGFAGLRRQVWALALVTVAVISVAAWVRWFIPAPPELTNLTFRELTVWVTKVAESGPAYYLLLPLRVLVRPAFSADLGIFVQRTIPALVLLWLVYLWVIRSDTRFEEASMERAEKVARKLEAVKQGTYPAAKLPAPKLRRVPFRLAPAGQPFVAVFWKNLISTGRISPRGVLLALLGIAIVFSIKSSGREVMPSIVGALAGSMACFLTLLGPVIARQDLRDDLLKLEVLKTYPLPGWSIVLGEILAPAAVLAAVEWFLLVVAGISLPSMGRWDRSPLDRAAVALGAAFIFPCLSLAGIVVQNAAALLLPGWVQLGKSTQRGIEAMGQRLITMIATMLVLVFAVFPAAVVFSLAFIPGYWMVGIAAIPPAALVAALCLLFEVGIGVVWLGRLFDRFDASQGVVSSQ